MKHIRLWIIGLLLVLSLLILSSCEQGEWPIGKDTVASWKQGKIQIQRSPDHSYALVVDHKNVVTEIQTYRCDSNYIYMVINKRVFEIFSIDDEALNTFFGLESISDRQMRIVFSDMIEAQNP